jgi:hypothetical protein
MHQINRSKAKRLSLGGLMSMLLLLYFVGAIEFDAHLLSHEEDYITLHSPEHERDTCHQSIYHPEQNKGCEHESHVSEFKTCHLCSAATHSIHLLSFFRIDLQTITVKEVADQPQPVNVDQIFLHLPSRAPPVA